MWSTQVRMVSFREHSTGHTLVAEPLSGSWEERKCRLHREWVFFVWTIMMGNPEGTVFGAKKQHKALIDNSTDNRLSGTRMRPTSETQGRCQVSWFGCTLYTSLMASYRRSNGEDRRRTAPSSDPSVITWQPWAFPLWCSGLAAIPLSGPLWSLERQQGGRPEDGFVFSVEFSHRETEFASPTLNPGLLTPGLIQQMQVGKRAASASCFLETVGLGLRSLCRDHLDGERRASSPATVPKTRLVNEVVLDIRAQPLPDWRLLRSGTRPEKNPVDPQDYEW